MTSQRKVWRKAGFGSRAGMSPVLLASALLCGVLALRHLPAAQALDNGLARTPVMGWNNWNAFHDKFDEGLIHATADLLVSTGLAAAGFDTLTLDDGWSEAERNGTGPITFNATRFPSGMLALADYLHTRGLRFGIYSDAGYYTCQHNIGSLGYEDIDAQQFADWKVDLLKYDDCNTVDAAEETPNQRFAAMSTALNKTGRPITYMITDWGTSSPWLWADRIANSWRTSQDISQPIQAGWADIMNNLGATVDLARYGGPGGWNDADMLEMGVPNASGLSINEQRAHFALWAILKSPLILSTDLQAIPADVLEILLSKEVIAINQDPLGIPGDLAWKEGPLEVYAAPLRNDTRAAVLFNRHDNKEAKFSSSPMALYWETIGLTPGTPAIVRDLYAGKDLGTFNSTFTTIVPAHGCLALKITPLSRLSAEPNWLPYKCNDAIGKPCPRRPDVTAA